jgi:hypothetical protein
MIRKEHLLVQDLESGKVSMSNGQVLQESEGILAKPQERNIEWTAGSRRLK